jgi:flavin reductase (DIM6/NTAB) family NADH-FMN oxidoreductase RutF
MPDAPAAPPAGDAPLRSAYLRAMAAAVTGVTVVSTDGPAGRFAQTVSAMCSVSAEPPTLLVCVNRASPLVAAVAANGVFAVNVLAAGQAHVADTFAGRPAGGGAYDFGCAEWASLASGAPALLGAAAVFDCTATSATDAGTHRVLFGLVGAADGGGAPSLAYARRTYGRHAPLAA